MAIIIPMQVFNTNSTFLFLHCLTILILLVKHVSILSKKNEVQSTKRKTATAWTDEYLKILLDLVKTISAIANHSASRNSAMQIQTLVELR